MSEVSNTVAPHFTDDIGYNILHTTFSSLLAIEAMDQIKGCDFYRKKLKTNGESFLSSLESITGKIVPDIWGVQDDTMYNIMDYYKELAHILARIEPSFMGVVIEVLKRLRERPEETAAMMGITMIEKPVISHD